MGALILILPVLAFDVWLLATTGRKQLKIWVEKRPWRLLAGLGILGVILSIWLAFFVEFKWGAKMRVTGFPIPDSFSGLEDGKWGNSASPVAVHFAAIFVNLISGLAAPLIPYKVAEFLRAVKAEL
jgi:hypothetical protein